VAVEEEIGDVTLCLLNLADQLGIDSLEDAGRKLPKDEIKYPVDRAKGRADKYTDLDCEDRTRAPDDKRPDGRPGEVTIRFAPRSRAAYQTVD